MKLLTEEIKNRLPGIGESQYPNAEVVCKFFDPCGSWAWYVLEGEQQDDGDWYLYGLVDGFEKEYGYFLLSELEEFSGPLGIGIERDLYFESVNVKELEA